MQYFNDKGNDNRIVPVQTKANTNVDKCLLFNIDIEKIYSKYYSKEYEEYTPSQYIQMVNDFKILLKLIDSFIQKANK